MKKSSTAAVRRIQIFKNQLTIGLDLGDRTSRHCMVNEAAKVNKNCHDTQRIRAGVQQDSAQSGSAGNRDAFPVGQPAADPVRARSDCSPRAKRATDRREPGTWF
jgi:hypothetical protein